MWLPSQAERLSCHHTMAVERDSAGSADSVARSAGHFHKQKVAITADHRGSR